MIIFAILFWWRVIKPKHVFEENRECLSDFLELSHALSQYWFVECHRSRLENRKHLLCDIALFLINDEISTSEKSSFESFSTIDRSVRCQCHSLRRSKLDCPSWWIVHGINARSSDRGKSDVDELLVDRKNAGHEVHPEIQTRSSRGRLWTVLRLFSETDI